MLETSSATLLNVLSRVYTSATCCAATSCADEQHVAGNKQHVAGNKLLVADNKLFVVQNMLLVRATSNMLRATCCLLRWCKRGLTEKASCAHTNIHTTPTTSNIQCWCIWFLISLWFYHHSFTKAMVTVQYPMLHTRQLQCQSKYYCVCIRTRL